MKKINSDRKIWVCKLFITAIMLFFVYIIPAFSKDSVAELHLKKADLLMKKGKYTEAGLHYKQALDDDEYSEVARYKIACMLFRKKDYIKSRKYFLKFCKKYPKSKYIPKCWNYLAILHNPELPDIDQVMDRFYDTVFRYAVLKKNIRFFPELFFFGQKSNFFDFDKSFDYNTRIMKQFPEEQKLYNMARKRLAIAYYIYFEDIEKSLIYIDDNKEDKRFNTILRGIIIFITSIREGISAENFSKKLVDLKIKTRFSDFIQTLYAFAIDDSNIPEFFQLSIADVQKKYGKVHDEELIMYFILSRFNEMKRKDLKRALDFYTILQKRASDVKKMVSKDKEFRYSSLEVYAKKAISRIKDYLEEQEKAGYQFFISDSFVRLGKYDKALSVLDIVVNDPKTKDELKLRAVLKKAKVLSEDLQNYDNCRIYLEKWEKLFKDSVFSAEYYHLLADSHLKLGNYSRAIEIFDDMGKNAGENELKKQALLKLAYIYEEWEDYDKASQKYEKFIELSAGNDLGDIARIRLAKLYKDNYKKPVKARSLLSAIVLNPDSPFRDQAKEIMNDLFKRNKAPVSGKKKKGTKKSPAKKKIFNSEEISVLKGIFSKLKETEDESAKLSLLYEAGEYFFETIKGYGDAIKFFSMYKAISDESMNYNERYYDVIYKMAQSYFLSEDIDMGIAMLEEGIGKSADDKSRFRFLNQKKKWKNEQGEEAKDTLWEIVRMYKLSEEEGYFNYLTEYYQIIMKEGTDIEVRKLIKLLGKYPESFHSVYYRMKLCEKIGEKKKYKEFLKNLSKYSQVADKIEDLLLDEKNKKIYNDLLIKYTEFLNNYPFSSKIPFVKLNIAKLYVNKLKDFDKGSSFLNQLISSYPDFKEGVEAKNLLEKLPYYKQKERLENYLINPDLTDDEKAEAYLRLIELAHFYLLDMYTSQKYEELIKTLKMNSSNRAYYAQLMERKKIEKVFGKQAKKMNITALEDIYLLLNSARVVRKENGEPEFLIRYLNEFAVKYPKFPGINKIYEELILLYNQKKDLENEEKYIWIVLKSGKSENLKSHLDTLFKMYRDKTGKLEKKLENLNSDEKAIVKKINWLKRLNMVRTMEEHSFNYTVEKGLHYFEKIADIYRSLGLFPEMYNTYRRVIDGAHTKKLKGKFFLKLADEYEKNGEFYDSVKVYREFMKAFPDYSKTPQLLLFLAKEYARREAFKITTQYF
ncbi:tetratricopeptide repeat protein, partial [bacterium]|nr:tetratricopeptide repeat protein [bacterium]